MPRSTPALCLAFSFVLACSATSASPRVDGAPVLLAAGVRNSAGRDARSSGALTRPNRTAPPDARVPGGSPLHDARSDSTGSSGDAFVPASRRPFPTMLHGSGPVLSPVAVVTITAANETLTSELDAFLDALIASSWWTNVTAPTTGPTQAEMVAYIQGVLAEGGPQPNGKTCYVLYLPAPSTSTYRRLHCIPAATHRRPSKRATT